MLSANAYCYHFLFDWTFWPKMFLQFYQFIFLAFSFGHVCVADGVCVQSIKHPGCVWDVKFMENGDIVTACSDGVVRIWTTNKDRIGDPHQLEAYASQLSEHECSRFDCQFAIELDVYSIVCRFSPYKD